MSDEEWIQAVRARFTYPDAIVPCFYTSAAWGRKLAAKNYEWRDGDLDREKTKENLAGMGLNLDGL
jgi:hypothetical protein